MPLIEIQQQAGFCQSHCDLLFCPHGNFPAISDSVDQDEFVVLALIANIDSWIIGGSGRQLAKFRPVIVREKHCMMIKRDTLRLNLPAPRNGRQ